jgi:DHA1 family bicyclomycin/chloramphenicol resistance-like MFS transporter
MPESIRDTFTGKVPSIGVLVLLISLGSIGSVLFTPGLSDIAAYFHISVATAQYAITVYVLGYAVAQLIHGPLVNHFGRKPILLYGIGFAFIFSVLSGFSKPWNSLILFFISRFFTALASGAGLVVSLTMINDVYTEKKAAEIMPITAISFAVLPGVAICVGGIVTDYLSWDWCFYFLALYYLVGFFIAYPLSETMHFSSHKKIDIKQVCKDYYELLGDSRLLTFGMMVGLTTVFVYVYAAQAPQVAIGDLKLSKSLYGLLSLIPFIFYAIGNITTTFLNKRSFSIRNSLSIAFTSIFILSLVFSANVWAHNLNLFFFYFMLSLIFFFIPVIWSNASVNATHGISDKANSNAVLSFLNIMGSFIGLILLTLTASINAALAMALVFFVSAIALMSIGIRNYRKYLD